MKKDQFIIAHITDFANSEIVLSYATYMASMLNKGLILLYICDPRYTTLSTDQAEEKMKSQLSTLNSQLLTLNSQLSYVVLKGDTREVISALPQLLGAVVIVDQVDRHARRHSPIHPRNILKNYADCKTAFLIAQQPIINPDNLKHVAMMIDFRKESKDKLIWSSYFPRFAKSTIHVLYYDYKDEFLHNKWYATMQQLHKLYNELGITFQPHIIPSKSTFPDVNALRFSADNGFGMLISVTTKEKDGLEFFIGTQEQRTVVNKFKIPILFLNPREDLYVLCD